MSDVIKALREKYMALGHAMQTGVAYMMDHSKDTEPKHLRVGINSAMSDHAGLVALLMAKGVITEEEYTEAIVGSMQQEVDRYTTEVNDMMVGIGGPKVTLG